MAMICCAGDAMHCFCGMNVWLDLNLGSGCVGKEVTGAVSWKKIRPVIGSLTLINHSDIDWCNIKTSKDKVLRVWPRINHFIKIIKTGDRYPDPRSLSPLFAIPKGYGIGVSRFINYHSGSWYGWRIRGACVDGVLGSVIVEMARRWWWRHAMIFGWRIKERVR